MTRNIIAILYLLLFISDCLFSSTSVKRSSEFLYGLPAEVLDNGIVRMGVTPQIGGRILKFELIDRSSNTIRIAEDMISLSPDEQWLGAEYGGIFNASTLTWPGPLWDKIYSITDNQANANSVEMTLNVDGVHYSQTLNLEPNSSLMRMKVAQKNISSQDVKLPIRIHAELAIGTCGDDNDDIVYRSEASLQTVNYRLGWENPRFMFLEPNENWIASVDTSEKLALIRKFEPFTKSMQIFYWSGHNQFGTSDRDPRDECNGFYGLDRFIPEQSLSPGQTIKAEEEFFIIDGIAGVDALKEYQAFYAEFDKQCYGVQQQAVITIYEGSAFDRAARKVMISAAGTDDRYETTIPSAKAGKAAAANLRFNTVISGPVRVSIFDLDGNIITDFTKQLKVDQDAYESALDAVNKLREKTEQFHNMLKNKKPEDEYFIKIFSPRLNYYLRKCSELLESGQFSQACRVAKEAEEKINYFINVITGNNDYQ